MSGPEIRASLSARAMDNGALHGITQSAQDGGAAPGIAEKQLG